MFAKAHHALTHNTSNKHISRGSLLMMNAKPSNNIAFRLHTQPSLEADRVEAKIAQKYFQIHGAKLTKFMPQLIEMHSGDTVWGGVGLQSSNVGQFFLEQYLEQPIEQIIANIVNAPANRPHIIEIGNFAVPKKGMGSLLITILAKTLEQAGYRWMVFTATAEVEQLIRRLGCSPIKLAEAKPHHLPDGVADWGNYYSTSPNVMACDLRETISVANNNKRLSRLFEQYASSTQQLSSELRST